MLIRILFTATLVFATSTAFAQVSEGDLKSAAEVTPFLIRSGCAEKVTWFAIIPGQKTSDCYGIMLNDVKVTDPLGKEVALGTVMIFPAARELTDAEEIVGDMMQVLKRRKVAGTNVKISRLRYLAEPLDLKSLSGNPADEGSYILGGLNIQSTQKSTDGAWKLTRSDMRRIGLN